MKTIRTARLLLPLLAAIAVAPAFGATAYTVGGMNLPKDWTGAETYRFYKAQGLATDSAGNVYVASSTENRIYKLTKSGSSWNVSVLAGTGAAGNADGAGETAAFNNPTGIAVDAQDTVIVADSGNGSIRKISPAGQVTTAATSLGKLGGVSVDTSGNAYAADTSNNMIWVISPQNALSSVRAFDSTGQELGLASPIGVAVDARQNIYVAEKAGRIRRIGTDGIMDILAGAGVKGYADGKGTDAKFFFSDGVANMAFARDGNLLVVDNGNCTLRQVGTDGTTRTVAGSVNTSGTFPRPMCAFADGTGSNARFYYPLGIAIDTFSGVGYVNEGTTGMRMITPVP